MATGRADTGRPATMFGNSGAMGASIKDGAGRAAGLDPSSPAAVAARMARGRTAAGNAPTARPQAGTQTGAAGMGGQAMSGDDIWGDGMINEEGRGSADDH
jgi:hypothetical protein